MVAVPPSVNGMVTTCALVAESWAVIVAVPPFSVLVCEAAVNVTVGVLLLMVTAAVPFKAPLVARTLAVPVPLAGAV